MSRIWHQRQLFVLVAGGLALLPACRSRPSSRLASVDEAATAATASLQLADAVRTILTTNCAKCHGNGASKGGFSVVTDLGALVAQGYVTPANAADSTLYDRVSSTDDPMPPAGVKPRPSAADVATIKQWIDAGALNPKAATGRKAIPLEAVYVAIRDDLINVPAEARAMTRYLSLTEKYNAIDGDRSIVSDDELALYRKAVVKTLNSLSWNRNVTLPVEVPGTDKTVLRFNLDDLNGRSSYGYGPSGAPIWTPSTWDGLAAANPYRIDYHSAVADAVYQQTRTYFPVLRGDWFAAKTLVPPAYHDLLGLPDTERGLFDGLGIDVAGNIDRTVRDNARLVTRAGFTNSGVSESNRVVERHDIPHTFGRYYWRSYDFAQSVDTKNIFKFPLGPADFFPSEISFVRDGGEMIVSLPNGFQAYLLVNAKGARIDKGPIAIVRDPDRGEVVDGFGCMSCHAGGIIKKDDEIRAHIDTNGSVFKGERTAILRLYQPNQTMAALYDGDRAHWQTAQTQAGIGSPETEPVHALVKHFEASLTLAVAAAELGLTADELSEKLRNSSDRRSLGQIINKGGTVKRDAFRADFADLARDLGVVGAPLPSGTSAGGATTSGGDLSGSGDFVCFFEAVGPSVNPGVETVIQAKGFSAASSDEATTKAAENCASIIDGLAGYKCRKAAAPCKRAG